MDVSGELRRYWDEDARTYDRWPEHRAESRAERAAWAATLNSLLPPAPARILDVGAGTGFLSLAAARLGHEVTALDISAGMLSRLEESAGREGLRIGVVCAPATALPAGPFDVVMERLLLWTVPEPAAALRRWRAAAPEGRLLAFEAHSGGRLGSLRRRTQAAVQRARGLPPEHHAAYPPELAAELGLAHRGLEMLLAWIAEAGWRAPELLPLQAVTWSRRVRQRRLQRILGVTQEYVIAAAA